MLAATRLVCAVAESRRVVHLSSMAVYGAATGRVDETHGLAPVGDYAVSKAQSEALLRDHVAAGGNAVILRPGCVHGPGSEQWTGRIARLLRAGRLGDLGPDGDGICNLTAAADLATAVAVAVCKPGINGEAFNVSDREPDRWNAYFKRLAVAIGATPLPHIPHWQLRAEKLLAYPLKAGEVAARKVKLRTPDPIPPSLLRVFTQEITLDHRKADRMLGFPRTPPNVALQSAVQWLQMRR
jgi:nucleoside-diphosphate-sugar epimerase